MVKSRKAKTVLIIEDEAEVRKFASRVLELEGYRVLETGTAEEGLELVRRGDIGLVLLDLRLPGQDGWVVLEQIKSDAELSAIPVIVFSASAGISKRGKALSMGAVEYLVKPLSAATLKEAVVSVLRRKR